EKQIAKQSRARERVVDEVTERGAVDPTRTPELHKSAERVPGSHQKPRPSKNPRREKPLRRIRPSPQAQRFRRRNEHTAEKNESDIGERRIADEIVSIEKARPAEPEQQRHRAPPHAQREENA